MSKTKQNKENNLTIKLPIDSSVVQSAKEKTSKKLEQLKQTKKVSKKTNKKEKPTKKPTKDSKLKNRTDRDVIGDFLVSENPVSEFFDNSYVESIHYYNQLGEEVKENAELVCATCEKRNRDSDAYWVLYGRSGIFHPSKTEAREASRPNYWKMVRVAKPVFDAYLSFLKTKKDMYYIQAGRRFGEARPGGLHGNY